MMWRVRQAVGTRSGSAQMRISPRLKGIAIGPPRRLLADASTMRRPFGSLGR